MSYKNTCLVDGCEGAVQCRAMCSKHYMRWRRYGDPNFRKTAPAGLTVEERLRFTGWRVTDSGCWEFLAKATTNFGYTAVRWKGRQVNTHRLAYECWVGPIPPGCVVCHRCDNPPCINPSHLFVGTQADNLRDMKAKGRYVNGATKLSEDEVLDIKEAYATGVFTYGMLADAFGVSGSQVGAIVRGEMRRTLRGRD